MNRPALIASLLAAGHRVRFTAGGYSMVPFVRPGDVLTVTPLDGTRLRPGDVVLYRRPPQGVLVAHRLIAPDSGRWRVGGDNLPGAEERIVAGQVLGTVAWIEHRGRRRRLGIGPGRRLIALAMRLGGYPGPLLRALRRRRPGVQP